MKPGPAMIDSQRKIRAARISLFTAGALALVKFLIALVTGSLAVLASAVDSLLDILMTGINFLAIRHAEQPADENHPFGHGKFETLATLGQALGGLVDGDLHEVSVVHVSSLAVCWPGGVPGAACPRSG